MQPCSLLLLALRPVAASPVTCTVTLPPLGPGEHVDFPTRTLPLAELLGFCSQSWSSLVTEKAFSAAYLVQGVQQPHLAAAVATEYSLLLRGTFQPGHEQFGHVHCPGSDLLQGRNALLGMACSIELLIDRTFMYYIYLDDDVQFSPHPTRLAACPQQLDNVNGRVFLTEPDAVAAAFREFEQLLHEWQPAVASPGRARGHGSSEIREGAVATASSTVAFMAVHRQASKRLLPYPEAQSYCPRSPQLDFTIMSQALYKNHILILGTSYEAIEVSMGAYSHNCLHSGAWVRSFFETVDKFPEEVQGCLVPTPDHVLRIHALVDLCKDEAATKELDFNLVCQELDTAGFDEFWQPNCVPWGSATVKPEHLDYAYVNASALCSKSDWKSYMTWLRSIFPPEFQLRVQAAEE